MFHAMQTGIYEIRNAANGNRYVGSAVNFATRWSVHRVQLRRGTHHSPHLQASWNKHGEGAFEFRKLLVCKKSDLLMYEQRAIDVLSPAFNVAKVAGSCLGVKRSPETKAKLSALKIGNTHTLGYRHTPEALAKLSAGKIGNTHTRGKKRDPEAVAKTAAAHRGVKRGAAWKAKKWIKCPGAPIDSRRAEK